MSLSGVCCVPCRMHGTQHTRHDFFFVTVLLELSVLIEILITDDKKLEAFDATDNSCCMCKINRGPFSFTLFNRIVSEIRYFSVLCLTCICRSHYTCIVQGC
jgi:hypothetical protein